MNIELREFQTTAVTEFVEELRSAAGEAKRGKRQAVSLSSPTGSGKTVMLMDAMERILEGDDTAAPEPDATFLWVTDQPELNLQTRDKMLAFSTVFTSNTLTVLDAEFDSERFEGGQVYFLNTQKLGKNASFIRTGDTRQWSFWETIENTVQTKPGRFYVVIDEAHRGMAQSKQAMNEANSIIQKLIVGVSDEGISPVPLIVGISATPKRFINLLQEAQKAGGKSRTLRSVCVEPAAVRESGLIKEAIQFVHPTEKQPSDMTLLRAAVQSWRSYTEHWASYQKSQEDTQTVRPLLAVQVADSANKGVSVTETDLALVLSCIEDVAGNLPDTAFAHAFQDRAEIEVVGRHIRHLPPSEIAADTDAQIVFFKTSLTTGWDCPRAEVMMSFRSAADSTHIAQLVGRMVRTPLARRIDGDEFLNTVALYLPHYDAGGLSEVVKKLTDQDSELAPATEIRTEPQVSLSRAPGSETAFAALSALPSYTVPRTPSANETKRLMKLALRLSIDGLRQSAPDTARELMLGVIDSAFEKARHTPDFQAIVTERDTLDIRLVSYLYGEETAGKAQMQQIVVSPENIEDLFETAGRKIGEGLHREWRTKHVSETGTDPRRAKLEFVALYSPDLKRDLDKAAKTLCQTWRTIYDAQIRALPEKKRQAYDDIQGLASEPEQTQCEYPDVIESKKDGTPWEKHLYINEEGLLRADFNKWETLVLKAEIKRGDVRNWLRVIPRKKWALTIPYTFGSKTKSVYIDFLVMRETPNGLVMDIVDPHTPSFSDAADKLAGLAQYAEKHGDRYGRIESIIVENDTEIRRLNLQDNAIRALAKAVKTTPDVEKLFEEKAVSASTG